MSEKKILKVFDQEGLYKTMAVEPSTAAGEICEKFAKKLFLNDSDRVQFSLFIIDGGVKQKLKPTDFPFEFLVKLENKTDYKFYFLNPNGETISFNPDKAKSNTTTTTTSNNSSNNNNVSTKPPSKTISRPGKGMSGILLRKKANRFEEIWAVSKDKYLRIYASQDDAEDNNVLYELSLENAVIELKTGQGSSQIVLTLSNSERHTFTSDKESDLNMWATELQCTTAYTASQTSKVATPAMAFIPTARDLNVKLQSKLENNEMQGRALIAWCNFLLQGRQIQVSDDIMTAFSDGSILINIIDLLFGKTLKFRKGKSIYEMQYNVDACLDALRDIGADFGKMISQDIVECKVVKVVLRLLWSIFVAFVTNGEKEYQVKDKIIGWAGRKVHELNKSIPCDSPSSLQNPLVFAAILAKNNSIDFNSVQSKKSKEEQAKLVIDAAFEKCSIPKIIDSTYWKEDSQDEKAYLLYLSLYYYKFSNEDRDKAETILHKSQEQSQAVEPENTLSARDKLIKQQQQQIQVDTAKKEQEKLEKDKQDKERLERERLEKEKLEKDRLEKERKEKERLDRERLEQERLEQERLEQERLEQDRLDQERLEEERLEQERLEEERLEQERFDREREEFEKMEQERLKEKEFEEQQRQRELEQRQQQEQEKQQEQEEEQEVQVQQEQQDNEYSINTNENTTNTTNTTITSNLQYDDDDDDNDNVFKPQSPNSSSNTTSSPNLQSSNDFIKEYQNRKFTKPLPVPSTPQQQQQVRQPSIVEEVEEFVNVEEYDAISPDKSNNYETPNTISNTNNNNPSQVSEKPISRAICRICLEGFGEVLFCSFAIGSDTLCGKVRQMVLKKMKVPKDEEAEYFLYIVRDGLERVLDDDEVLLEAEDKVDRFVFKKNDIERKYMLSNHRG